MQILLHYNAYLFALLTLKLLLYKQAENVHFLALQELLATQLIENVKVIALQDTSLIHRLIYVYKNVQLNLFYSEIQLIDYALQYVLILIMVIIQQWNVYYNAHNHKIHLVMMMHLDFV